MGLRSQPTVAVFDKAPVLQLRDQRVRLLEDEYNEDRQIDGDSRPKGPEEPTLFTSVIVIKVILWDNSLKDEMIDGWTYFFPDDNVRQGIPRSGKLQQGELKCTFLLP